MTKILYTINNKYELRRTHLIWMDKTHAFSGLSKTKLTQYSGQTVSIKNLNLPLRLHGILFFCVCKRLETCSALNWIALRMDFCVFSTVVPCFSALAHSHTRTTICWLYIIGISIDLCVCVCALLHTITMLSVVALNGASNTVSEQRNDRNSLDT